MLFLQIFSVLFVLAFVYAYWTSRPKVREPLPGDFFMLFFLLTWSPLCLFPVAKTHISSYDLDGAAQIRFTIAYNLMVGGVAVGYFIFRQAQPARLTVSRPPMSVANQNKLFTLALCMAGLLVICYLGSAELRTSLSDNLEYVRGRGVLSYTQLRRESEYGGYVFALFHSRFQYSLVFLLFVTLVALAVGSPRRYILGVPVALVLFVVCATTLKKMPYVFYFLAGVGAVVLFLWQRRRISTKMVSAIGVATAVVGVAIIFALYSLQYRDFAGVGVERIIDVIQFRVLSAYPAACKLYIDVFPEAYSFTYGRTSALLSPLIGYYGIQPYALVPAHFGFEGTTFPGGFMAYAYADFGFIGIFVYSVLVGGFVQILNRFCMRIVSCELWIIATVSIGFSMLWFWSKPVTTAMLTGGLGLIPILLSLAKRIIGERGHVELNPLPQQHSRSRILRPKGHA